MIYKVTSTTGNLSKLNAPQNIAQTSKDVPTDAWKIIHRRWTAT